MKLQEATRLSTNIWNKTTTYLDVSKQNTDAFHHQDLSCYVLVGTGL